MSALQLAMSRIPDRHLALKPGSIRGFEKAQNHDNHDITTLTFTFTFTFTTRTVHTSRRERQVKKSSHHETV
jgi:hypothetical protein